MTSLTAIAENILAQAKRLDEQLNSEGLPPPSFEHDSFADLSTDLDSIKAQLIDSSQTLKQLVQGPKGSAEELIFSYTGLTSLHALWTFKLPQAVPLDGSATYHEIASKTGLSEFHVRRFMRHAMTNHILAEPSVNVVRHTAFSRLLVVEPDFFEALALHILEFLPAANNMMEAIRRFGPSGEQNETGYNVANNVSVSIYEFLSQNPERAQRFATGMRFWSSGKGWDVEHLASGYDWKSLDHVGARVVDVGGGEGSVSQVLARSTKNITYIVQDLPGTVEHGREILPAKLKGRVEFEAHDFFSEQTIKSPDAFLLRWILHNWSDGYCIKILRALIPALKDGCRLIIYEFVLKDGPETELTKRTGYNADMIMASCFNGVERPRADWYSLFEAADKRFTIRNISRPEKSMLSIIEVVWDSKAAP